MNEPLNHMTLAYLNGQRLIVEPNADAVETLLDIEERSDEYLTSEMARMNYMHLRIMIEESDAADWANPEVRNND